MKHALVRVAAIGAVVVFVPGMASAWGPDNDPGRCTGQPFKLVRVSALSGGEKARADKVDRNKNGWVCRKDIPGQGGGNTGQNSNIKDDKI